jgi:hypothetical protein
MVGYAPYKILDQRPANDAPMRIPELEEHQPSNPQSLQLQS